MTATEPLSGTSPFPTHFEREDGTITTNISRTTLDDQDLVHRDSVNEQRTPVIASPHRRRSMSLASGQTSVESVLEKAKRAASSLWVLLHAEKCTKADCPIAGCLEAKMMHLHLKTCHATSGTQCRTHYHGCDQARKLLEHHRRCRSVRSRQFSNNGTATSWRSDRLQQQQPYCLICSLVARHAARSILGRGCVAVSASLIENTGTSGRISLSKKTTSSSKQPSVVSFAVSSPSSQPIEPLIRPFVHGNRSGYTTKLPSALLRSLDTEAVEESSAKSPLKTYTSSSNSLFLSDPDPVVLSEPDAATLLCSLNASIPGMVPYHSSSVVPSVETVSTIVADQSKVVVKGRRRAVSLGDIPSTSQRFQRLNEGGFLIDCDPIAEDDESYDSRERATTGHLDFSIQPM